MTPLQRKVYDFVDRFWKERGYAPSYREIGEGIGTSVSGVHRLVNALAKRKHVHTIPRAKRSVEIIKNRGEK